jgi:hypothetical protein
MNKKVEKINILKTIHSKKPVGTKALKRKYSNIIKIIKHWITILTIILILITRIIVIIMK